MCVRVCICMLLSSWTFNYNNKSWVTSRVFEHIWHLQGRFTSTPIRLASIFAFFTFFDTCHPAAAAIKTWSKHTKSDGKWRFYIFLLLCAFLFLFSFYFSFIFCIINFAMPLFVNITGVCECMCVLQLFFAYTFCHWHLLDFQRVCAGGLQIFSKEKTVKTHF